MSHEDDVTMLSQRIALLERQNRRLRSTGTAALAILVTATVAVVLGAASGAGSRNAEASQVESFEEITVGRINIAGPDGINRMVLSHQMPDVPHAGHTLERTVPPDMAGIIFCAPDGDEVGGIGASGTEQSGHSLFALDYRGVPLEAIGFGSRYTPGGQSAGLMVMEPPAGSVDVARLAASDEAEIERLKSMMVERVLLGVENSEAGLIIKDRNGRDRIVISVDAAGTPIVMTLDEKGREIARLGAD